MTRIPITVRGGNICYTTPSNLKLDRKYTRFKELDEKWRPRYLFLIKSLREVTRLQGVTDSFIKSAKRYFE